MIYHILTGSLDPDNTKWWVGFHTTDPKKTNESHTKHSNYITKSIDFLFNNKHYSSNNEKNEEQMSYDSDNNIKPIEVNSNNDEYIIFLLVSLRLRSALRDARDDDDYRTYFSS